MEHYTYDLSKIVEDLYSLDKNKYPNFDKEEFISYQLDLINSYKKITPTIIVGYNGLKQDIYKDFYAPNLGHSAGDMDLTLKGYQQFKKKNSDYRFIKLGVDSWLCDEDKIIDIFNKMEENSCGYAGNKWHDENNPSLASDIIFADIRFGNVFEGLTHNYPDFETSLEETCAAFHHVIEAGKAFYWGTSEWPA
jgi:hypothetical protein